MTEKTVGSIVVRLTLDASEEVLGINGLKALLNFSKMSHLLEDKPDYSFEKKFTGDEFWAITSSYIDVLGQDGARAVYRMIGKAIGKNAIKIGAFNSINKDLAPEEKLFAALELYTTIRGGKVTREGDVIVFDNPECALCAHAKLDQPICTPYNGFLDMTIEWAGVKNRRSVETACKATGDKSCRFEILPID
jgi:predicted hydrocarbon binding protein